VARFRVGKFLFIQIEAESPNSICRRGTVLLAGAAQRYLERGDHTMVYFNPIGGAGPVQPLGAGSGSVGGASGKPQVRPAGVDAFTPSFGAGSSSGSGSSVADIVGNVARLSAGQARGQLSAGTNAGLDSFAQIHQSF